MHKLSVFITTYNNARTLGACLESVKWADEILVLDSYSSDETVNIAKSHGCIFFQHAFMGYGKQKQMAMEKTSNDYVLLLDADEMLSEELQGEIRALLQQDSLADGYDIPRQEQVFWKMSSLSVRMNYYLRLFNKKKGSFSFMPVHAAPEVTGKIERLRHAFYHFGETDIHTKVEKINAYSTGLVADKLSKGKRANPWILIFYPPLFFIRLYFFKRNFRNGWAGFIVSVVGAFYAFLKYAKLYEHAQFEKVGDKDFPKGAPPMPSHYRVDGVGQ